MQEIRKNWKQQISLPSVSLNRIFSKPVVSQVLQNDVLDHGLTNNGTNSQIQSARCFCRFCKLKMVFMYLNDGGEIVK